MNKKCWLFVPAKERTLSKVTPDGDCAIIIDLEDSISEEDKETALQRADDYIARFADSCSNIVVRVNRSNLESELRILAKWPISFMIPKFESMDVLEQFKAYIQGHNIVALIETPKGVVNVESIAASGHIHTIAFGAEDYTAAMNMDNSNELLVAVKNRIVTAAKAYNVQVVDTPSFNVTDNALFEIDVDYSVRLGFDGKMAIHPRHAQYIHEKFSRCDIAYLNGIIKEYDRLGGGVQMINGVVYESMHINRMKKIIKESQI